MEFVEIKEDEKPQKPKFVTIEIRHFRIAVVELLIIGFVFGVVFGIYVL